MEAAIPLPRRSTKHRQKQMSINNTTYADASVDNKQTRMNNLRNKVQLIGNIGNAPEIVSFENGSKLAKMSLATSESYRNAKGEKVTETQWHNLTVWGKQAETIEKYVGKGQEMAIEGKLVNRAYETKDGEKRYKTEIIVQEFLLLGKKSA